MENISPEQDGINKDGIVVYADEKVRSFPFPM